jgi:hypothetical protein
LGLQQLNGLANDDVGYALLLGDLSKARELRSGRQLPAPNPTCVQARDPYVSRFRHHMIPSVDHRAQ